MATMLRRKSGAIAPKPIYRKTPTSKLLTRNWQLYLMLLPVILNFVLFHYWPLWGLQIAFKQFNPFRGIDGSPWVGFQQFQNFFGSYYFGDVMGNTLFISITSIVFGFPCPILLALLLNEVRSDKYKRFAQTVSYLPFFVSVVVVVGMFKQMLALDSGVINDLIELLGGTRIYFLRDPNWFVWIYILMIIWRWSGYDAIIYLATITGIDPTLYEAAQVDGAGRLRRMWHITLPGIRTTLIILFIIRLGGIMNLQWQEILLMQNSMNQSASEVIQTFVYKRGLLNADYSFGTAVGLFQSVIGFIFVLAANKISKVVSEVSIF
jgi:putative aldouronate transport system permease protein